MENQGLGAWVTKRRVKSRDRAAIIFRDQVLTYSQLDERVNRLADALARNGVRHGDRIAYLGENHPAFLETFFATTQLGAIFVPMNTRLAPPELHYALEDSGSTMLFHSAELAELAEKSAMGLDFLQLCVADVEGSRSREELLAGAEPIFHDTAVSLDDPAMILYTSGTTGHAKGALLLHRNFTWNSFNVLVDYDVTSSSVALMISPLFHVAALGMGLLPVMLQGGTIVLEERFDPQRVLELIPRHRVSMMSGVPTTYQMLAEHPNFDQTDLSSLHTMTCGGSSVPRRIMERYEAQGLSFTMGYGMTETSPGVTVVPSEWSNEKAGSAGLPLFFTDVRVVDELGRDLPAGETGEVVIRGNNVIEHYWNKPEASASSFVGDGWFRSGDMGFFDADGFLTIADRLKDMIISGGENIYPAEIEQIIAELPDVSAVAIIGVPDRKWGEVPRAIVTLHAGQLSFDQLHAHLENRVARYKIPKSLIVVDEFPRTASGKIRKTELRERYGAAEVATG